MKKLCYAVLFPLSFCSISCESGVETALISPDKLVAVSSLISPQDSVVSVYVYQGKQLGDVARSDLAVINDAKVVIEEGTKVNVLSFNPKSKSYQISNELLNVSPTKQYRLRVETKNGIVLQASCSVPKTPEAPKIKGVRNGDDYAYALGWPSQNNVSLFTFTFVLIDVIFKPQLGASSGPNLGFVVGNNLFDNDDRGSKVIENKIFNAFRAEKIALKTTLYSLDENAFKYLKTKNEAYSWGANTSGLIPNLREPRPVFSNVDGGTGIFGAYNQTTSITPIR